MAEVMLSFPPDKPLSPEAFDKQISTYIAKLEKLPPSSWTKPKDGKSVLDLLDPALNSIPYLVVLNEAAKAVGKDKKRMEELLDQIAVFFSSFDPLQIRYIGEQWKQLWYWAAEFLQKLDIADLSLLSTAILRLDPSAATFTSLHTQFLRLCLANGTPSQALPILDKTIYALPHATAKAIPHELLSEDTGLSNTYITLGSGFTDKPTPESVLQYYLGGAHVYIGTRNFHRARVYLENVMLHPALNHSTSALQVEAYKKWLLVGLLSEGKSFPYIRTVDQATMKSVKAVSKAYDALVENFEKRDWMKFAAEVDVGQRIWVDDGNLRLVQEAGHALMQYRVSDLQKTYAALPVARVASHLDLTPDDTLTTLDQMIRSSSLNASLTSGATAGEAVLRFHLTSPSSISQTGDLEAQTERIEALITAVRDADRRLELTREFVDMTKRTKRSGADADLADQMDLSWDTPGGGPGPLLDDDEGEEDIMA